MSVKVTEAITRIVVPCCIVPTDQLVITPDTVDTRISLVLKNPAHDLNPCLILSADDAHQLGHALIRMAAAQNTAE